MACMFVTVLPGNLSATAIVTGPGSLAGNVSISNLAGTMVGVSTGCIDWGFSASDSCETATPVNDSVSTSDTVAFTSGATAQDTIMNLPLAVPLPVVNFETIQAGTGNGGPSATVHFDLTTIVLPGAVGNCTSNAANNVCGPGGASPFILVEGSTGNDVTVKFQTFMDAYTGASTASGFTPYQALFSTDLSGNLPTMKGNPYSGTAVNITDILGFELDGGTISSTWSAQESPLAGTPEPRSAWMLFAGIGMMALGLAKRKSRTSEL